MLRILPLLFPFAASATESTNSAVSGGTYVQATLALLLIVGVLIGAAWLARKVSGGKGFGQGGMKIVGGVALGPRERIVLLEIGNEWLVVGIVPGQIRTLHRLEKGTSPPGDAYTSTPATPFPQWLKNITEQRKHD